MAAPTPTDRIRSLPEALREATQRFASLPAIRLDDRTITHAEFGALTDRVAAGLAAQGLRKGDRIGVYAINGAEFAAAYHGILKAGGTVVPLNLLMNPKELAFILNDAGARMLVVHQAMAAPAAQLRALVPGLERVIGIGAVPDSLSWPDLLGGGGAVPQVAFDPAEDVAVLLYTSGTTGYPKGAMLTHRNLTSNVGSIAAALKLEPGCDTILTVLPMFHAFAATVCMNYPLLEGGSFYPLPKFDPELVADAVERHKVTVLPAVPSMFNMLLRLPDEAVARFASMRFAVSGGAALPAAVLDVFEKKFGKAIYEGDGPTECSPVTCVNPIGGRRKLNSVGPPVPGVEMKILDDQGRELPHNEIGEICVRGPNVMKGYWNRPDDTRESFFGEWFRTGDLGTEDDDGYFFIVDRKKDMVIVNGMNVYPRMVEEALFKHAAVREAAVVGAPDELHGEVPVAFVALKEGAVATAQELRRWCLDHLGRHEVPRTFTIVAALPRNAAGKVLKRELRKTGEFERGVP